MPKLRMSSEQQALYEVLRDFTDGAGMINAPQLAKFWGRDVRCVREWLAQHELVKYRMGNGYGYLLRDVAKMMVMSAA